MRSLYRGEFCAKTARWLRKGLQGNYNTNDSADIWRQRAALGDLFHCSAEPDQRKREHRAFVSRISEASKATQAGSLELSLAIIAFAASDCASRGRDKWPTSAGGEHGDSLELCYAVLTRAHLFNNKTFPATSKWFSSSSSGIQCNFASNRRNRSASRARQTRAQKCCRSIRVAQIGPERKEQVALVCGRLGVE